MMFWRSSSSSSSTATTTTTTTTTTATTTAASVKTTRSNSTPISATGSAALAAGAAQAVVSSYTLSEQRRNELLLAARANRVSWIDGVDEARVAAATAAATANGSNTTLERGRHAGSSIPLQCQQALETISTDLHALLSSLEQLKRTIIPNSLVPSDASASDTTESTSLLLYSDCVDADGQRVPYRTIFQDLHESESRLSAWLDTHGGVDALASPSTLRKRMSIEDKEVLFLLAFRELVALLKSPKAAELVYQIQTFVTAFETTWDLPQMLEHHGAADRPGARVQAFIAKLVLQLQHNDKLLELLGDMGDTHSNPTSPATELLSRNDDWSADLLHEVLEAFILEKVYVKALTPTPAAAQADDELHKRLETLAFVDFRHLDVPAPATPEQTQQWRDLVTQLQQLPRFLAPRRKMDCILRVCQGLTALLAAQRPDHKFPSADEFLPALIYVLLHANPRALQRNVAFILEYRRPSQLVSETGYFFTHLVSSVAFLEQVDGSLLTISPEDFDAGLRRSKQQVVADTAESVGASGTMDEIDLEQQQQQQRAKATTPESHEAELPSVLAVRAKRLALLARLA